MTIPLPEPELLYCRPSFVEGRTLKITGYSDYQLRAYGDARAAEAVKAEREQAYHAVNAFIKQGPLQGNGRDDQAQRNGMILAVNILAERLAAIRKGE